MRSVATLVAIPVLVLVAGLHVGRALLEANETTTRRGLQLLRLQTRMLLLQRELTAQRQAEAEAALAEVAAGAQEPTQGGPQRCPHAVRPAAGAPARPPAGADFLAGGRP